MSAGYLSPLRTIIANYRRKSAVKYDVTVFHCCPGPQQLVNGLHSYTKRSSKFEYKLVSYSFMLTYVC